MVVIFPPARTRLSLALYQVVILIEQGGHELSKLWWSLSLSPNLMKLLETCSQRDFYKVDDNVLEPFATALERFGYQYAARDWFQEQTENPELMRSRGFRQGEPLPRELGLFDEHGIPLERQQRKNWRQLRCWLVMIMRCSRFSSRKGWRKIRKWCSILKQGKPCTPCTSYKILVP
ncbi:hypothetical protein CCP3SC15_60039 [Gammaproteobacteria bacterium]